jgi:hypothetical protein
MKKCLEVVIDTTRQKATIKEGLAISIHDVLQADA